MILGKDGHTGSQTRNSGTRKGLSLKQDQIKYLTAARTKADLGKALSRFALAWM
jgi:hypothetical protein